MKEIFGSENYTDAVKNDNIVRIYA